MPIHSDKIQAIFFDVDGTLNDTDDQFVDRIAKFLRPFSVFFPGRDPRSSARRLVMTLETPANFIYGIPDRFGIDDELAKMGETIKRILGLKKYHNFRIIPHSQETLQVLRDHYPLAIVSARGRQSTLEFLRKYQLEAFFQCVVTAQTAPRTKPHPGPVLYAAEHMHIPIEACLMVGDTTVDIKAGKSAGCQTVGVLSGFGDEAELRAAGADIILPSVNELCDILPIGNR